MFTQDYLNLRLVRLKASEQWKKEGEGISFVLPRAGVGHYLNTKSKQVLSPGDVLLLNGDPSARVCPKPGNEFAFSGFSLRIDHLYPLFSGTEISLLETVMEQFKGYKFYPASSPLAGECHKLVADIPPQFNLDHRGQLLRLASALLNEEFKMAHANRIGFVRPEDHLVQVFEKLSVDEILSLSVPELAKHFGCSRRHLNRLFHQYFGFSVAALRMEMRLMKAISLLRNCDAKVINVAEQCGFNHLGLFNTCFRKRYGTSPGQWRKAMAQDPDGHNKQGDNFGECPLRMTGLCPQSGSVASRVAQPAAKKPTAAAPRPAVRPTHKPKASVADDEDGADLGINVAAAQKPVGSIAFQVRAQQ